MSEDLLLAGADLRVQSPLILHCPVSETGLHQPSSRWKTSLENLVRFLRSGIDATRLVEFCGT